MDKALVSKEIFTPTKNSVYPVKTWNVCKLNPTLAN